MADPQLPKKPKGVKRIKKSHALCGKRCVRNSHLPKNSWGPVIPPLPPGIRKGGEHGVNGYLEIWLTDPKYRGSM